MIGEADERPSGPKMPMGGADEADPLSFEASAGDFLDLAGVPAEKRDRASKALKAAIMACMGDSYGEE